MGNLPWPFGEQEQSRPDTARAVQTDLVEEALRADLREILGCHVDLSRVGDWLAKGYDPALCAKWSASCAGESGTLRRWPILTLR